ncbi:MAG: hypothetical protein FJ265_20830, partial [Planctomycetes bacterium]|nr:hypothetical protein [Planctomycetota bacterium]
MLLGRAARIHPGYIPWTALPPSHHAHLLRDRRQRPARRPRPDVHSARWRCRTSRRPRGTARRRRPLRARRAGRPRPADDHAREPQARPLERRAQGAHERLAPVDPRRGRRRTRERAARPVEVRPVARGEGPPAARRGLHRARHRGRDARERAVFRRSRELRVPARRRPGRHRRRRGRARAGGRWPMIRALLVGTALGTIAAAQFPVVQTVYNSGSTQSRYDMVILGDGYQAAEQTRFNQDVQTFLTALFQKQPYTTFAAYYNVHTVFRPSVDSGADHPDANPPIWRNTVYNASYNTGGVARCLYIGNTAQASADAALAPANEGRVLVFVNDSRYGGCAGGFAVSYNGSSMSEVQIHEIGHSIGELADEYDYPNATYTGPEPGDCNITTSSIGQKWSHWWGYDGISAFQGAGYHQYGLWRPKLNCLMRSLGVALCAVCKEQISKLTNSIVNVIDTSSPAGTNLNLN